jgi:hypothetical protein
LVSFSGSESGSTKRQPVMVGGVITDPSAHLHCAKRTPSRCPSGSAAQVSLRTGAAAHYCLLVDFHPSRRTASQALMGSILNSLARPVQKGSYFRQ